MSQCLLKKPEQRVRKKESVPPQIVVAEVSASARRPPGTNNSIPHGGESAQFQSSVSTKDLPSSKDLQNGPKRYRTITIKVDWNKACKVKACKVNSNSLVWKLTWIPTTMTSREWATSGKPRGYYRPVEIISRHLSSLQTTVLDKLQL